MATYNGAKYLGAQIASIKAQTLAHWFLLVRDDGSTDGTVALLKHFAEHDSRILLIDDALGTLGAAQNFGQLMKQALALSGSYFAFSDQDDVWNPNKLERQFKRLLQLETQYSEDTPILIHSDLTVVSEKLDVICSSFMSYQGIRNPATPAPTTVIFQNHIVGCTLLGNKALLEKATPLPPDTYMHDWWLGLFTAFFGITEFIPQSLVAYRQHSTNQVGAGGIRWLLKPTTWYRIALKLNRLLDCSISQSQELLKHSNYQEPRCKPMIPTTSLQDFAKLSDYRLAKRITTTLKHKIHCQNGVLTAFLYVQIACFPLLQRYNRKGARK